MSMVFVIAIGFYDKTPCDVPNAVITYLLFLVFIESPVSERPKMLLLLILLAVACFDIQTHKIPNSICLYSGFLGFLMCDADPKMYATRIVGILFIFFLGMLRMMGLGDIKLWMAATACIGFLPATYGLGLGAFFFAVFSVLHKPQESISIIKDMFISIFKYGRFPKRWEQPEYPFAPFIFTGTAVLTVLGVI